MTITRAYKTALKPTRVQAERMRQIAGAVRYVWNAGLSQRRMLYSMQRKKSISFFDQCKELTSARADIDWLNAIPRGALNAALQNLDRAYSAAYRRVKKGERAGFPKFQGKWKRYSFKFFSTATTTADTVTIPGVGIVRLHESDYLPIGRLKIASGAVTHNGIRWSISLTVEEEIPDPVTTASVVTVHLGLRKLAYVLTEGAATTWLEEIEHPRTYELHLGELRRLSRALSRCKMRSGNWHRAKLALTKCHAHIAQIRRETLHEMTTEILKRRPARLIIQQWGVNEMLEERKLSRHIADSAWYEIRRQIEYKAKWRGAELTLVPHDFPASKRCSQCGNVLKAFPLSELIYRCAICGMTKDRERNAVDNLRQYTPPDGIESRL